jgi:hypothetical protein
VCAIFGTKPKIQLAFFLKMLFIIRKTTIPRALATQMPDFSGNMQKAQNPAP